MKLKAGLDSWVNMKKTTERCAPFYQSTISILQFWNAHNYFVLRHNSFSQYHHIPIKINVCFPLAQSLMVYLPGRRIVTLISLADTPFSSSSSPSFSLILVLSESIESGLASGPNLKITSTIDLPSGKHLKKKGENRQLLNQKNNNSIIQYVDDSFT